MKDKNRLIVAGIDEAGRGPLAGPVTVAATVFRPGYKNSKIQDSKKLSKLQREKLYSEIINNCLAYEIVNLSPKEIDEINIRQATLKGMRLCAKKILEKFPNSSFLIDGNMDLGSEFCSEYVIKGDAKFLTISAASILAKVSRDRIMKEYDKDFPQYGFAQHNGYPTKMHKELVQKHGPCPIHRMTFSGVKGGG